MRDLLNYFVIFLFDYILDFVYILIDRFAPGICLN